MALPILWGVGGEHEEAGEGMRAQEYKETHTPWPLSAGMPVGAAGFAGAAAVVLHRRGEAV